VTIKAKKKLFKLKNVTQLFNVNVGLQLLFLPQSNRVFHERRAPPGEGADAEGEAGEGQRRQDVRTILYQVLQVLQKQKK
jgi:hypothetical protein